MSTSLPRLRSASNRQAPGFSAVVMAGGHSTRMGRDKAFLRLGREPLLARQLRCLREAGAAELLISGREGVNYADFGARVVYDDLPGAGPLAGLAAALKVASHPILVVLAVDMPEMSAAMLRKILNHCDEKSGCVPIDDNGFQPLAAVYPRSALALAGSRLVAGTFSMQAFVKDAVSQGQVQPLALQPSEQIYFTNWNKPSDWSAS